MLQTTTKTKEAKIVIFAILLLLNLFLEGCSHQLAQNRADYFTWATHQHREFEQEKAQTLPHMQYFSCGDQKHPCKPLSKIYSESKHQAVISDNKQSQNRGNS